MYKNKRICVVIPCYNEQSQIENVLSSIPEYIDQIIVIDDASQDTTLSIVHQYCKSSNKDITIIEHENNQGVGGAIASGYKLARDNNFDVAVVMAGDGQMAPDDLSNILDPVVSGDCDYSKGNRLFSGDAWNMIPRVRYIGNSILSLMTKVASGYWHIADSQSGYTAINQRALKQIDWDQMYKSYGQPNDLLVRLNIFNFKVRDVIIQPIYNVGEKSGIKPIKMMPRLFFLLMKLFLYRMKEKYIIRDFHPLLFFYFFGFILFLPGLSLGMYLFIMRIIGGTVAETSALFAVFMATMGLQFLLFAMWFDMESNKDLK